MEKQIADELFDNCLKLARAKEIGAATNNMMHETLVVACAEATKGIGTSFGNVFSQVDYLCKRCGLPMQEQVGIQTMRRHSNKSTPIPLEDWIYDVRSLAIFVSSVLAVDIPSPLVSLIPHIPREAKAKHGVDMRYVRCIVSDIDDKYIYANVDSEETTVGIRIDYRNKSLGYDIAYIKDVVKTGSQLNLLDCSIEEGIVTPRIVVVEPDFLVDISSIAKCFADYGHSPEKYIIDRLGERANSQAILLGNFAGDALDDIINSRDFSLNTTVMRSFKSQALQFCTCPNFAPKGFMEDARRQSMNITEAVKCLFDEENKDRKTSRTEAPKYNRQKVILEPSFVCERLGLQGRADLMTTDFRLLVEQKSGKNYNIESNHSFEHSGYLVEPHYIQLLLYFGVLRYNYGITSKTTDIYLLYSRYPASQGLQLVNDYRTLFAEAIKLRNLIVANEIDIARRGFEAISPRLTPETINVSGAESPFFNKYVRPQIETVTKPLATLSPLERAYFNAMATFVYREQAYSKMGAPDGHSSSGADLWNMPLHEKKEMGNIYTDLTIKELRRSVNDGAIDTIVLAIPPQGDDFLPNFRRGDMVYLYPYLEYPDVRRSLLFKGTLIEVATSRLTVRLNDGQQNEHLFTGSTYAVEHGCSDVGSSSHLRGLLELVTAPAHRRDLLLGLRKPNANSALKLTRQYNPYYNDIILAEKQARDYYLLIGPPGTGKTSMALRFMVEEELADDDASILLMSYTNRAVDEICSMLEDANVDYMRLGNESSCEPRFAHRLMDNMLGGTPKLSDLKIRIGQARVIVGTTCTIEMRPSLFNLKKFSLAIIDEASQILEPAIVGLLTAHRNGEARIGRFVLVGDYKQLPAVVQQPEECSHIDNPLLNAQGITDSRQSLFERLIRWERHNNRSEFIGTLRRQGRMHPDIARFPNEMFYREERLEPVPCPHQTETSLHYDLPSEDDMDDILRSRRMIFIPSDDCRNEGVSDKVNASEALIVADIVRRIYRFTSDSFDPLHTLGIIVPYRNQIAMIRRELDKLGIPELKTITIDTVERYQGSQRDVIVYSFTVQSLYQLEFLTSNTFMENGRPIDRKLNVAITRARKQMIMTGNAKTLNHNPIFNRLISRYRVSS